MGWRSVVRWPGRDQSRRATVVAPRGLARARSRQSTYWSGVAAKSAGSFTPVRWFGQ